jgi:hypothetical protein
VERWLFLRSGIGRVGILVVADGLGNQNFQVPAHRFSGCVRITGAHSSFRHLQTVPGELATTNPTRDLGSPQLCICSTLVRPLPARNSTSLSNLSSRNYRLTPIRQDCTAFRSRASCQLECNLNATSGPYLLHWLQVHHKREKRRVVGGIKKRQQNAVT